MVLRRSSSSASLKMTPNTATQTALSTPKSVSQRYHLAGAFCDASDVKVLKYIKLLQSLSLDSTVTTPLEKSLDLTVLKQALLKHLPSREEVETIDDYYNTDNPLQSAAYAVWLHQWAMPGSVLLSHVVVHAQRQRSPCCAAASVAGAVSAIHRQRFVLTTEQMLKALIRIFDQPAYEDLIVSSIRIITNDTLEPTKEQRRQGIDEVERMLTQTLNSNGFILSNRGEGDPGACDDFMSDPAVWGGMCLYPRDMENGVNAFVDSPLTQNSGEEGFVDGAAVITTKSTAKVQRDISCSALLRLPRPSTARVGFTSMAKALQSFPAFRSVYTTTVRASTYHNFLSTLMAPFTAVIIHLPNHYALVFGAHHPSQSILTARKGQLPRDWISWEEIMEIQRRRKSGIFLVVTKKM
eukprot:PhF_6_TR31758/c0_g1_i2/m.46756